LSKKRKHHRGS